MTKSILKGGVALLVVAGALPAAGPNSAPTLPQPRSLLYHFVRSAALVSRKADELDSKDGTGQSLRRAFSSTIGLTDADRSAVFAVALELDAQFAALDQQAAAIIANAKASRAAGGLLPPPPTALATLQQQKVALMNALAPTLNSRLSTTAITAIAGYLNRSHTGRNGSSAAASVSR